MPIRWLALKADIIETTADGLLCSANPFLNLSGGVGGAFNLKFGPAMQAELHEWLDHRRISNVKPGTVVFCGPNGSTFKAVGHAVAIDAFYDSSKEFLLEAYTTALTGFATRGCSTVSLACLGCGYGRIGTQLFIDAVHSLVQRSFPGIDTASFVTDEEEIVTALANRIGVVEGPAPITARRGR